MYKEYVLINFYTNIIDNLLKRRMLSKKLSKQVLV